MPIREYECVKCGTVVEVLELNIKDKEKEKLPEEGCPSCGGKHFKNLMSGGSFIIKGW